VTRDQFLTLAILSGMAVLFLSGRIRYDLVALLGLLAGISAGIVPANHAFSGFADPVLPLIAAALVMSAAVGQSGAVETLVRWLRPVLRWRELQVGVLVTCVAVLSAFMKNVGALAMFLPVAVQVARRSERSAGEFLMPLSFASLLGGSATLIGTSPNLLISSVRQNLLGAPFAMFDFAPVGAGVALCGVCFLAVGWRLLCGRGATQNDFAFSLEDYTSELRLGDRSPYLGRTVGEIEELSGGAVTIAAIVRNERYRYVPGSSWQLHQGDILVVEAEPQALEQLARDGNLEVVGGEEPPEQAAPATTGEQPPAEPHKPADLEVVEAVVTATSALIGRSAAELHLRELYGVNVLAVSRRGDRTRTRLRRMELQDGDAIVFQGYPERIFDTIAALGCLPLAERRLRLGRPRKLGLPLLILLAAMVASGFELVPAAVAFVGAAVAILLGRLMPIEEAYRAIEWPILILIGAMIPVGEAVAHTGTAGLVANGLAHLATIVPDWGVLAVVLGVSMLVTPILHHAPAVLVMGPIAASLAKKIGCHVDPFLIAVALGAGSDFLSPIGHQSNTLVMGAGGYRFGDYWHLGLPLSLLVLTLGVVLILVFWPLH
jgi:di/tricarboxylate transporter